MIERGAVHVADVDARPGRVERPRHRGADAAAAGGDQHAQAGAGAKQLVEGHGR